MSKETVIQERKIFVFAWMAGMALTALGIEHCIGNVTKYIIPTILVGGFTIRWFVISILLDTNIGY